MKKVFVVLPSNIENYEEEAYALAHEVEVELDTYCEIFISPALARYFDGQDDIKPVEYLSLCLECMSRVDVVVFAYNWREDDECLMLHKIVDMYDLDFYNFYEDETPEEEFELMPCPKCNKRDAVEMYEDKQTHQLVVRCRRCGRRVAVLNTMDSSEESDCSED